MRVLLTKAHGYLDYLVGVILIIAPWVLGFADGGPEQWVPVVLGIAAIVYSLLTDYELGAARAIPMPVHLMLDAASGLFLLVSPWLFDFADDIRWPHVLFGLLEIGAALVTRTTPGDRSPTAIRATAD